MDDIVLKVRRCKRGNEVKLDISNRQISIIPLEVFQLTNLEMLDLSNNKISSIDSKLSNLKNLKFLDLSNNSIVNITNVILSLENLEVFNISNNPLASQFDLLLQKENQSKPNLRITLENCLEGKITNKKSKPDWFESTNIQDNLMKQLKETEDRLKNEQIKAINLNQQLESSKAKKISFGGIDKCEGYLNINEYLNRNLEIEFSELEIGDIISQGKYFVYYILLIIRRNNN